MSAAIVSNESLPILPSIRSLESFADWKPYENKKVEYKVSGKFASSDFGNKTSIRKAKISDVIVELTKLGLSIDGSAEEKRLRLVQHLFPSGKSHNSFAFRKN